MRKLIAPIGAAMLCFGLAGTAAAATYSFSFPASPLAIAEGDYVYADILVDGSLGNITDVNVFVDITHTWIGDLDIYIGHQLIADLQKDDKGNYVWNSDGPAQWVQLYNQDGDSRNNMTAVTFDDQATTSITDVAPPYGPGSYQPTSNPEEISPGVYESNLLADYNGDLATGMWRLALFDNWGGETGTMQNFRIDLETASVPQTAVPLPGAVVLLGSGLGALAAARRARRK